MIELSGMRKKWYHAKCYRSTIQGKTVIENTYSKKEPVARATIVKPVVRATIVKTSSKNYQSHNSKNNFKTIR